MWMQERANELAHLSQRTIGRDRWCCGVRLSVLVGVLWGWGMTDEAILTRLDMLTQAVIMLAQTHGVRLSHQELADRLCVHRTTITRWSQTDREFPRPDKSGKWLLADVVKWEASRPTSKQEKQATR